MMAPVTDTTQIYSLTSMRKTFPFAQLSTKYALLVQYLENALPSESLKKNGESGEESFLKAEKFLESFLSIEVKSSGPKLGRA